MIERNEVFQIGRITKPHGLKGELELSYTSDIFNDVDIPCFICEVDGILVPFFIEDYRFKNDGTVLVKFETIDDDERAKMLAKSPVYIERKYLPTDIHASEVEGADYYIGFQIYDEDNRPIGKITAIDDETENALFFVERDGSEVIIPATDDYIIAIDDDQRIMQMELPEGLLDLSAAEEA